MTYIFKFGNHLISGISLFYIKPANAYTLLITFFFIHMSIDILHYGFRFGLSIGDGELFFKIQTGIRA